MINELDDFYNLCTSFDANIPENVCKYKPKVLIKF